MTMRIAITGLALGLALGGCHRNGDGNGATAASAGDGISVPAQFAGSWGADCNSPWVRFDPGKVHDFPANADYPLKAAALDGGNLKVTYTRPDAEVTDTYASDGTTLTLTKTATAAGGEAEWHKAPMSRCP